MFLETYTKEMFMPKCNPNFQSVHCIAHLAQDISEVLPYLNTELGGGDYIVCPPSLTFKYHGKLVSLHAREIFVNALKDEAEADSILSWLKTEINDVWGRRSSIIPTYETAPVPQMMAILKLLPRTNCRKCGDPTCTVFALKLAEGIRDPEKCPVLIDEKRYQLKRYLSLYGL